MPMSWKQLAVRGKVPRCEEDYTKRDGGAELGYPGMILDEAGEVIEGFLFNSDNLSDHWSVLMNLKVKTTNASRLSLHSMTEAVLKRFYMC